MFNLWLKSLHVKNAVSEYGKAIWIAIGYDKNKITLKLQIIAQARLPQVTTSARKLPVGKQLNLALTKQRLLLERRSQTFLQPLAHFTILFNRDIHRKWCTQDEGK